MKVYRGPAKTDFHKDVHQLVSQVKGKSLREAIERNEPISFNISKTEGERNSTCALKFENADLSPILQGIDRRLSQLQSAVIGVRKLAADLKLTDAQKLERIDELVRFL